MFGRRVDWFGSLASFEEDHWGAHGSGRSHDHAIAVCRANERCPCEVFHDGPVREVVIQLAGAADDVHCDESLRRFDRDRKGG